MGARLLAVAMAAISLVLLPGVLLVTGGGQSSFPGAVGPGAASLGARGSVTTPVVLVVNSTADNESNGCCAVGESPCSKGACTLREALTDARPAFVACNVSGVVRLLSTRIEPTDYKTVDFGTCPGPLSVANQKIEIDGAQHVILRSLRGRPAGEYAATDRGTATGCNATAGYCTTTAGDPAGSDPTIRSSPSFVACTFGAGGDAACASSVGAGSVCRIFQRAQYEPASGCETCPVYSDTDYSTGDVTGCLDTHLAGGAGILDGITILGASLAYIDRGSFQWSCDESVDLGPPASPSAMRVTIANSIIGAGVQGSTTYPCAREANAMKGLFVSQPVALGTDTTDSQILAHRNLIALSHSRVPLVSGATGWLSNNVIASNGFLTAQSDFAPSSEQDLRWDVLSNLYLQSVDEATARVQGYCDVPGDPTLHGRACMGNFQCRVSDPTGTCPLTSDYFFVTRRWGAGYAFAALFLSGNRFYGPDRVELAAPIAPEYDAQWDRFRAGTGTTDDVNRPRLNPDGQGVTGGAAGEAAPGSSSWRRRRTARLSLERAPAIWESSTLWASLRRTVGAERRDAVDADTVAVVDAAGDYDDQPFLPSSPRAYPPATGVTWADTDADGMDDAWEAVACGGLSCGPLDRVGDYLQIQRFLHADLFGLPRPSWGTACGNNLDDDGDGLADYPADPDCDHASDTSEAP